MSADAWWAKGVLFENCNCQMVCTGHFHFTQMCTHDRCVGYWGIQLDEGRFGDTDLAGMRAMVIFDSPQQMASGDWVLTTYVNEECSPAQQAALERILSGEAGGPWKVLSRFVRERKPTRRDKIEFTVETKSRMARVGEVLRSTLTWMKGRDRDKPVMLENVYNQIHAPSQVLSMGSTSYQDGAFRIETANTHALHSQFSWSGTA